MEKLCECGYWPSYCLLAKAENRCFVKKNEEAEKPKKFDFQSELDRQIGESAIDRIDRMFKKNR